MTLRTVFENFVKGKKSGQKAHVQLSSRLVWWVRWAVLQCWLCIWAQNSWHLHLFIWEMLLFRGTCRWGRMESKHRAEQFIAAGFTLQTWHGSPGTWTHNHRTLTTKLPLPVNYHIHVKCEGFSFACVPLCIIFFLLFCLNCFYFFSYHPPPPPHLSFLLLLLIEPFWLPSVLISSPSLSSSSSPLLSSSSSSSFFSSSLGRAYYFPPCLYHHHHWHVCLFYLFI